MVEEAAAVPGGRDGTVGHEAAACSRSASVLREEVVNFDSGGLDASRAVVVEELDLQAAGLRSA